MKAAFSSPGMMTMHFAFSISSRGMALSGVAMISWNTRPAFSTRPMSSSRSDAKAGRSIPRLATDAINTFLYIWFSLFVLAFVKTFVTLSVWLSGDNQLGLAALRRVRFHPQRVEWAAKCSWLGPPLPWRRGLEGETCQPLAEPYTGRRLSFGMP